MLEDTAFLQHVAAWRKLPFAERNSYYDTHIWPTVWQRFVARTAPQSYRGVILPGTLQTTTAALLLGALNPERAAFLLTKDTSTMPAQVWAKLEQVGVAQHMRCQYAKWNYPEGDHADGLNMYKGLQAVLQAWHDLPRETIAVDLTGGKSTMTVALSKAAYVLKLPEVYIDSDYEGTQLIEGTQRLSTPPDPYEVFGDVERDRAWGLYRSHEYAEAARLFGELAERLEKAGNPALDDQSAALLAQAYAAWEVFDLGTTAGLLMKLDRMNMQMAVGNGWLRKQIAILGPVTTLVETPRPRRNARSEMISRYVREQVARLRDATTIGGLLAMFYANALRRAEQQRRDSAALMLYRCLELMSQQRLAVHGVLTEYSRDGLQALERMRPRLEAQYDAIHQHVLQRGNRNGLPKKITLIAGYVLLATIEDPFTQRCDIKLIEDRADARNQSILAHGFDYIDPQEYQEFKAVVDTTIQHWSEINGVVWADLLASANFAMPEDVRSGEQP